MSKYDEAIKYFEDAIRETDEIIADCSLALQAELNNQKQHFTLALSALRQIEFLMDTEKMFLECIEEL